MKSLFALICGHNTTSGIGIDPGYFESKQDRLSLCFLWCSEPREKSKAARFTDSELRPSRRLMRNRPLYRTRMPTFRAMSFLTLHSLNMVATTSDESYKVGVITVRGFLPIVPWPTSMQEEPPDDRRIMISRFYFHQS
jgi:hypothetical protein